MRVVTHFSLVWDSLRRAAGLVRLELRSGLRLAAGLSTCALISLFFARFVLCLLMPLGGAAHGNVFCALGFLFASPIVAGAFEHRERAGITQLLQAAPASKAVVFGAKFTGALLAVAAALAVTGAVDALLVMVAPDGRTGPISDGLEWDSFRVMVLVLGALGLAATTLFAIVLRSALGACLGGGIVAGIPAVASNWGNYDVVSGLFMDGVETLIQLPGAAFWGFALPVGFLGLTYPLRGLAARSLPIRILLPAAGTACLLAAPFASKVGGTLMSPAPTFEMPDGRVFRSQVSPDGSKLAVELRDYGASQVRSLWLVDTETYEVEPLPSPLSGLAALLRFDFSGTSWSSDSTEVCGTVMAGEPWMYAIDVQSKEVLRLDCEAFATKAVNLGWTYVRAGENRERLRVSAPGFVSTTIDVNRRPKVAQLCPWLVFYQDRSGRVHRYDGRTGNDFATELVLPTLGAWFDLSPRGEWLLVSGGGESPAIYHVESGRRKNVEDNWFVLTDRERPLLVRQGKSKRWMQVGLDDSIPFEPECGDGWLVELDEARWLCTVEHCDMYVLDGQGKVLHTLRQVPKAVPER